MASRLELQTQLEEILGSRNVYYQPPESIKLQYPAIVYSLDSIDSDYADNIGYFRNKSYQIMLIDKNPESEMVEKILHMPMCKFNNSYPSDGLNHFVFTLYY